MHRTSTTSDHSDGKIIQLRVIALETLYLSEIGFSYRDSEKLCNLKKQTNDNITALNLTHG